MRMTGALLCVALLTVTAPLAARVPAPVETGLASAVARGDQEATRVQAELIVAGELDGDAGAARATLAAAAQRGDAQAAYVLGVLAYQDGDGGAARRWWRQAAAAGKVEAHYNLGLLLARDPAEADAADREFEAAARARHVLACYALGTRLAARDEPAARHALECAASQGYAPAQFNLATLFARAARGADDLSVARRWYAAAAPTFAPAAAALAALPPAAPLDDRPTSDAAGVTLRDHAWVMAQPASSFTVQIASGVSAEVLEALLRREVPGGDAASVLEHPGARQPYSAIVGVYPDRASADAARAALPASLRANTPWVRRLGSLQQALRSAAKDNAPGADAHAESN